MAKKKLDVDDAVQSIKSEAQEVTGNKAYDWKQTLSTGSTLLDLAISGGRCHKGGVPPRILMEVYGRSGSGKTSILSELCGHAQYKGGEVMYLDPEARLDQEYSSIYGMELKKDCYFKPGTVSEMFTLLNAWNPSNDHINVLAADSLAALSTELEMEKGDKMGMRRAKEFSEGLRKTCRVIEANNWIIACSNQVRQGDYGDVTTGGKAIEFYASLRISVNQVKKIEKEKSLVGLKKIHKQSIGIESKCIITKSSIDCPYRTVPIYIIFDHGIDNVRGNLQYIKDTLELPKYWVGDDHKGYMSMDAAITYVEENDLENLLVDETIRIWHMVEDRFKMNRKKKLRD